MAVPKLRTGSYFPDHHSSIRLVGAVPTEQADKRTEVKAAVTSAWRLSNSAVDASEDSFLGIHNRLHSPVDFALHRLVLPFRVLHFPTSRRPCSAQTHIVLDPIRRYFGGTGKVDDLTQPLELFVELSAPVVTHDENINIVLGNVLDLLPPG